jgi:integrase
MPTIRERKKKNGERAFQVQVRMTGFPARTGSFATRRAAERWARAIEVEMDEGRHFRTTEARRRSLAAAIDKYLLVELPKKADPQMHRACLTWWKDQIGDLTLAQITAPVIVEYRDRLKATPYSRAKPNAKRTTLKEGEQPKTFARSNGSVNRHLSALSHLFTVARKEWHWVTFNPLDQVEKLPERKRPVRALSDDERTRLLEMTARDATLHTLVVLALTTAARAGELLALVWRDVDLVAGRLLFPDTKADEPRVVWIHGEALRLLKERAERHGRDDEARVFTAVGGGQYDYAKPFKSALADAKIKSFTFHNLRASAATYLAMAGASEREIKAVGGWRSNAVDRYIKNAAIDTRAAMQQLAAKIDGGEPAK